MPASMPKILTIVLMQIIFALIHIFRLGQIFNGQMYNLYYGYFSDIALPFCWYFLLSINEWPVKVLNQWYTKGLIIFVLASSSEIAQFFGYKLFGVTFDPFDILAYGIGVILAVLVDVKIFTPYLSFWSTSKND